MDDLKDLKKVMRSSFNGNRQPHPNVDSALKM